MVDFDHLSEPVQELFLLGEDSLRGKEWPNYLEYGITSTHIPELLDIIRDIHKFWYSDEYDDEQANTPIHAWRALGQLRAEEAIQTLVFLAHENEEINSDWIGEEVPKVMAMIGPAGIPALKAYLTSPIKGLWASVTVAHCLEKIGNQYPESRAECIAVLQFVLENFLENDETLNAFLISYLIDLKADEAVSLVEQAYESGNVDISVTGDFEENQIEMGLLEERLTPPLQYRWMKDPEKEWEAYRESERFLKELLQKNKQEIKKADESIKKKRRGRRGKRK